jgi:hypothetical protein
MPDARHQDGILEPPITSPDILPRDGRYSDYCQLPWEKLLAGDARAPPSLDLKASEILQDGTLPDHVTISRRWDVDSFLALATSLGVHRGGFDLAYRPPFLRGMTQNPHVTFAGHTLSKIRNLRFGRGLRSGGYNYECHVFFPNMARRRQDLHHVTDEYQQIWIDDIVIPAVQASCPNDIKYHHPRSFKEVDTKAMSRQELYIGTRTMKMDLRYCIPEEYLDLVWTEIQTRCQTPAYQAFRDVFLIISAHDL